MLVQLSRGGGQDTILELSFFFGGGSKFGYLIFDNMSQPNFKFTLLKIGPISYTEET